MKRLLAIFPIFLLTTMLAGCSGDDSQEEYDGEIVELNNGTKYLLKETSSYSDSLCFFQITVPWQPVKMKELPSWLHEYVASNPMFLNIVQGEWVSSNESLYVVFPFAPSSQFSTCFLSDGSVYHVIPGSTYDGYDGYGGFLNSTKNWRGICQILAIIVNK